MVANFKRDLERGKKAEELFALRFPQLIKTDGFKGDFIMPCGSILEIKNDSYCPDKWPNFIMERYRSGVKPGGCWQSLEHGAKYFAYNFTKNNLLFIFDTAKLVIELESIILEHKLKLSDISNGSYNTRFFRVPRGLLKHLELPHSILGEEVNE